MEVVASEDFSLTDSIKETIHQKIKKIEEIAGDDIKIHVYLHKEHDQFQVKMHANFMHTELVGESEKDDFYQALNDAKQKLLRQVKEQKERMEAKRHS